MQQTNQQAPAQSQMKIKASEDVLSGEYANVMQVAHNREEFVLDFIKMFLPQGKLVARVIMSPGHAKRVISALEDNIKKYEDKYGTIEQAIDPQNGNIGFHDRGKEKNEENSDLKIVR